VLMLVTRLSISHVKVFPAPVSMLPLAS
jgi:hypothetical protein